MIRCQHHRPVDNRHRQGREPRTGARPGDAYPVVDAELGRVHGALDQSAFDIEELVGEPIERRAGVWTTVAVSVNPGSRGAR